MSSKRITRKEAQQIVDHLTSTGSNYKHGYCCWQNDGIDRFDLVELGYNASTYGWNFTLYYHEPSDTIYCDCYRYPPKNNFKK